MAKITVLGMGAMGSRMALSLLKAGHKVTVWNRSLGKTESVEKAGAKVAETPRTAVKDADFAIAMLRDDEASKQVWLDSETGALAGLSQNAVAIESSTLTVAWTKELGQHFQEHNRAFLDAPVAGTRPQADVAKLIYFVGGDTEVVAKAHPILEAMGSVIHHIGSVGSGMTIKLAVNALFGTQIAILGELIGLMRGCGLDEAQAVNILTSTPVCSPAAKAAAGGILARNFSPMFPIKLVEKDLNYGIKMAQVNNVKLPLVEATQHIFTKAIQQGYGDNNITGIAQLYL
ncbi:MAG: NAD(P)-dependent oxidoreductase [Waterburya sp.]